MKSIHNKTELQSECKTIANSFSKISDWLLYIILAVLCFLLFAHTDIVFTGNQGMMVWSSHFTDMYDFFDEWSFPAAYFPTTYYIFAIWSLPLKFLGISNPNTVWDSRIICTLWYKSLTSILFVASAILIYRIALLFGMKNLKAKTCMFAFLTLPIAFYSQFIFSQYDIITIFFMLCGLYYYYLYIESVEYKKRNLFMFCLFFGIATTCKYFAILVFFVLLLLKEKRIIWIFFETLLMISPLLIELLIYYPSYSFRKNVLGFGEIDKAMNGTFQTGIGTISLFQVICCLVILWAYFLEPKEKKDIITWSIYLCCGICFSMFDFMGWNPQWLIFAAPFWVLGAFINKHCDKFLFLDVVFVLLFYTNIFRGWTGQVDDGLLDNGILGYSLSDRFACWHNMHYFGNINTNLINMSIFVLVLSFFVFKHPKFALVDFSQFDNQKQIMLLVRLRLLIGVAAFIVPTFISFRNTLVHNYKPLGLDNRYDYVSVYGDKSYKQVFSGYAGTLDAIMVRVSNKNTSNGDCNSLVMDLWDNYYNKKICSVNIETKEILSGDYARVSLNDVKLYNSHTYSLVFSSPYSAESNCCNIYTFGDANTDDGVFCLKNGIQQLYNLGVCLDMS